MGKKDHAVYGKRGNRTGLSEEKWADAAAEQAGKRGNKQQAVKPVQNTAVAGEQIAVVLDTKTPLDGGHGQIAKLTDDGGKKSIESQCRKVYLHDVRLFQCEAQAQQHCNGSNNTADAPLYSFIRTDHGTKFVPSQGFSG